MPSGWSTTWQLSAEQWDVLSESLRLHSYPVPIQVRVHGRTDVERARIRTQVTAELHQLGLLATDGRVEPDLQAAMALLHRPACWLDSVWLPDESAEQPVRVVAARTGGIAVCASQRPELPGATLLEIIPAGSLSAAVVSRLPAHPPATTPAVSVPVKTESGNPVPASLVPAGRATPEERSLAAATAILEQPHRRAGQIVANLREPSGRVRRSPVLRWCDNAEGRYQVMVHTRPDERHWLTATPADARRITGSVQWLLDSVRDRQPT